MFVQLSFPNTTNSQKIVLLSGSTHAEDFIILIEIACQMSYVANSADTAALWS